MKIRELTARGMFYFALLAVLILAASYYVLYFNGRKAMGMSELPSLQNLTAQPEEKSQQVYGCKTNSTCATQLQSYPFVLPFP